MVAVSRGGISWGNGWIFRTMGIMIEYSLFCLFVVFQLEHVDFQYLAMLSHLAE